MTTDPDGIPMGADDDRHEDAFDLVMPFVVVASADGPYEDHAFAAGWICGRVDGVLQTRIHDEWTTTVRTDLVEQLDLVAMQWGYKMTTHGGDDYTDEYCAASFKRVLG